MCRNGVCENTPGSYRCVCNSGFASTSEENRCEGQNEKLSKGKTSNNFVYLYNSCSIFHIYSFEYIPNAALNLEDTPQELKSIVILDFIFNIFFVLSKRAHVFISHDINTRSDC